MKINEVTATSFGPFVDEQLVPATGMTVVWGLNEAGKSSWHSALHIAVCGLRRGRGANTLADRKVITRNQPWSGAEWRVGARISLDGGEELTIGWDLDAKIATVIDSLGRDRSNEWMHDGAVDLAKLVGLDRESFLATASVRQSDLLATASAALAAIDRFAQENVGLDRSNSSKPLAAAKRALAKALQESEDANEDHRHRLELVARIASASDAIAARTDAEQALGAAHRVALLGKELSACNERDQELAELGADLTQIEDQERRHLDACAVLKARAADLRAEGEFQVASAAHAEVERLRSELMEHGSEVEALDRRVLGLTAAVELAEARVDLAAAEQCAEQGAELARVEEQARGQLQRATEASLVAEVVLALALASRTRTVADRASDLQRRHPSAPTAAADRDDQVTAVRRALERWAERPETKDLAGPTSSEIEIQLEELPTQPEGDLQPATEVIEAEARWRLNREQVQAHRSRKPETTSTAELQIEPTAIRALAERLDAPRELGLNLDRLPGIVQSLCEDFLMGAHFRGCMIAGVDDSALVSLMAEVDAPELQRKVLRLRRH